MKRYEGRRNGAAADVTVDRTPLNPRLDLWKNSPSGFEWGYAGSGSAQLALAILADHLGEDDASLRLHQEYKHAVIGNLPYAGWMFTEDDIDTALNLISE